MKKTENMKRVQGCTCYLKFLSMISMLAAFLCFLPGVKAEAAVSGDYEYVVADEAAKTAIITKYNGQAANLSIPARLEAYTVVGIGDSAFKDNTDLQNVTIPAGIESIEDAAFRNNYSLETVTFASGSSLKYFGDFVFFDCSRLKNINLPEGATELNYTFTGCYCLENTKIPESVTDLTGTFRESGIKSITIPAAVERMEGTFENCKGLTGVTFAQGSKLVMLLQKTFYGCKSLKTITLPEKVECMTHDGYHAVFAGCTGMKNIFYPATVADSVSRMELDCVKVQYTINSDGTINATITGIPESVSTVEVPAEIRGRKVVKVNSAVSGVRAVCDSHPAGEWDKDAQNHWITSCSVCNGSVSKEAHQYASGACTVCGYKHVCNSDTVGQWGMDAGGHWVAKCSVCGGSNLTKAAHQLSNGTCGTCGYLEPVTRFTYKNAVYKVTDAGLKTVQYVKYSGNNSKSISIPATVTYRNVKYKVTGIAANAFKNNKKIIKVTIGSNVKTIGSHAFYNCKNLSKLTIGKNVTTIGNNAFAKCVKLTKVTIPDKVSKIGKQAFYGCRKLKNITIKTTKLTGKRVGSRAFKGIQANVTIKAPAKKLKAYKSLLKKKGVSSRANFKKA